MKLKKLFCEEHNYHAIKKKIINYSIRLSALHSTNNFSFFPRLKIRSSSLTFMMALSIQG